jgi:hypothetical protein
VDLRALNADLARALGVGDVRQVRSITLRLQADDVPTVTVERIILPGQPGAKAVDDITAVVAVHRLVPSEPEEIKPT